MAVATKSRKLDLRNIPVRECNIALIHPIAPIKLVILPVDIEASLAESNACGGWDKRFKTEFSLEVIELDSTGFVIENQTLIENVRAYFKAAKYIASCEQLCQCIVHLCYTLVGPRLSTCHVKVYNLTGWTEITWKSGQQIPPLPFCSK